MTKSQLFMRLNTLTKKYIYIYGNILRKRKKNQ